VGSGKRKKKEERKKRKRKNKAERESIKLEGWKRKQREKDGSKLEIVKEACSKIKSLEFYSRD
jgi:hypothetical protein